MKKARLLKLAKLLRTVPERKFNLGLWADKDFSPQDCYTQACAIGWATTIFKGLELIKEPNLISYYISFSDHSGWSAVMDLFGISEGHALYLFSNDSYEYNRDGPKAVAIRIGQFVASGIRK